MKTTLEISDSLYREVKAKAASEGRTVTEVVSEALHLVLSSPVKQSPKQRFKFPIIRAKRKVPLTIPDDVASRLDESEDMVRHEASLR